MVGKPGRLVLAGSVLVDLVMRVDELPHRGEEVPARAASARAGGGFALLASAARHGLRTAYAGNHGTGVFGDAVRSALTAEGITTLLPASAHADTGFRMICYERGGGASAFVAATTRGVETHLDADRLVGVTVDRGDLVCVLGRDLTRSTMGTAIARWLRDQPRTVQVAFDPGDRIDAVPWAIQEQVLRRCDLMTIDLAAAKRLLGTGRPDAVARALKEYAPRLTTVVVRDGDNGCWVSTAAAGGGLGKPVEVLAPPMDRAAGTDVDGLHTGVFLAARAHGHTPTSAALRANVAVALHRPDDERASLPGPAAVDRFLATRWRPA